MDRDTSSFSVAFSGETVGSGEGYLANTPVLRSHAGTQPDLFIRWNEVPRVTAVIDVVVHLHGFSQQGGINQATRTPICIAHFPI